MSGSGFMLFLVTAAAVFSLAANVWRAFRSTNRYGTGFHLIVAGVSGYFLVIFILAIINVLDPVHFGPVYARPATMVLLFLLGGYAIAYPGIGDK